jgi:glycosyltransferase involved in cell wall biosynthesis
MCSINDVSIIIPTYNRSKLLVEVLPSYLNQKFVSEIIIVDDGSESPVQDALKASKIVDERIHVIRHNRSMGLCSARNTGILAAKAPWIFFGEDDLILSENHIENLHTERVKLGADLICGNIIQQESDESLADACKKLASKRTPPRVLNRISISIEYGSILKPIELPFAHAIFMAPTEILKTFLFSTRIGGPSFLHEDQELQLTLREAGYRLFATPKAVGLHLATLKGHGSGTRLKVPIIVQIASSVTNTFLILNDHYLTIAPFFSGISRKTMIRKAILWRIYIEVKRRMQQKYPAFNKLIGCLRKWIS